MAYFSELCTVYFTRGRHGSVELQLRDGDGSSAPGQKRHTSQARFSYAAEPRAFLRCTLMISLNYIILDWMYLSFCMLTILNHPQWHVYKSYYGILSKSLMIWTWSLMLKNLAVCVLVFGMIGIVKKITTTDGHEIPLYDEVRYLGIFIIRSTKFICSVDHAKRSFCPRCKWDFCQSWQTGFRRGYSRAIKTQMLTCSTVWTRGLCSG